MALYDARKAVGHAKHLQAADYYQRSGILELLLEWAEKGITQEQQCEMLNDLGYVTCKGTKFSQGGLSRIIKRAQELGQLPLTVE
jgi:hypothetical protein